MTTYLSNLKKWTLFRRASKFFNRHFRGRRSYSVDFQERKDRLRNEEQRSESVDFLQAESNLETDNDPYQIYVKTFKTLLPKGRSWVLFENGTVVLADTVTTSREELETEAKTFLRDNGKVVAGCPLGDFNAIYHSMLNGWVVSYHSNRIYNFVSGPKNVDEDPNNDVFTMMAFGLTGRGMRKKDSVELNVVFVCWEQ